MWDQITSFIMANLIPASLMAAPVATPVVAPPPLDIEVQPLAVLQAEYVEPQVSAQAALIIETNSNEALYAYQAWDVFPIASLTKLMTALVVREHLDLDQEVTVSTSAARAEGSQMGLVAGEVITVQELLRGLLINSGNDAAFALAEAVAEDEASFVALMNQRTEALGLSSTFFVDPAGLGDGNKSSAFEVAHLAKQVFRDPFLQSVMREKELSVFSADGGREHKLKNTNRLLGTDIAERIIAGKTGTTPVAGQCLISFVRNENDRTVMAILLGSRNRYTEMKELIEWVDLTYRWE